MKIYLIRVLYPMKCVSNRGRYRSYFRPLICPFDNRDKNMRTKKKCKILKNWKKSGVYHNYQINKSILAITKIL